MGETRITNLFISLFNLLTQNKIASDEQYLRPSCTRPSPSFFKFCIINAIPRWISSCHSNSFVQFIHLPIKKAKFQTKHILDAQCLDTHWNPRKKWYPNLLDKIKIKRKKIKSFRTNVIRQHGLEIKILPATQCFHRKRATLLFVVLSLRNQKISFPIGESWIAVYRSGGDEKYTMRKCRYSQKKWQKINIGFKNKMSLQHKLFATKNNFWRSMQRSEILRLQSFFSIVLEFFLQNSFCKVGRTNINKSTH